MFSRRSVQGLLVGLPALVRCAPPARSLVVYNWGDYLAPEVMGRFAALAGGATVTQDFYLSEAELFAKLKAGAAFDVCVPIDYQLSRLQQHGFIRALDLAKIANVKHLSPKFPPWRARAERGGECFAVPYLWGTTGIGYDSDRVDPPPSSWNALFEVRYNGRVSVIDSKGDVFDQALLAAGMDINTTDKDLLRARIFPRLQEQKKILRAYDSNPARALVSGETWIAQIDSGDLMRAQKEKPSLRYVIPAEGAALWVDYLAIPAAGAQVDLSHAFLDFMLDPEIAAINANFLHFATPNQSALERGLVTDKADPQIYPPSEQQAKLFVSENWYGNTQDLVDKLWLELRGG